MSDQKFDEFFKGRLQSHSSAVSSDMWQRIQDAREKDRRRGFWWLNYKSAGLALIALMLTIAVYYSTVNSQNDRQAKAETQEVSTQETSRRQNSITAKPSLADSNNPITSDEAVDITTGKSEAGAPSTILQPDVSTIHPSNASALEKEPTAGSITKNNDEENIDLSSGSKAAGSNQKLNVPGTANVFSNQTFATREKVRRNQSFYNKKVDDLLPASSDFMASSLPLTAEENASAKTNIHPFIGAFEAQSFKLNSSKHSLENLSIKPINDCPSAFGERPNDWFAEVYFSPDYALKQSKGINNEYLRRKDSTENFRSAFTAGFRLSKGIGEHLLLKTGVQFSQINEKFTYQSENERRTTTVITIRTIIRGVGDTLRISDTSTVQQIGYRVKTTYNRYRSFDIPVLVGFEWGNDNFRTNLNTGLIFNLQSWQQGDMLDTSYSPVSFDKGGTQVFKKNLGLGVYASIAFLKRVGTTTEIFAEPYFRYNISNMTNAASPFNQRFHVAGLNLGVRYKFSGNRQHY